MERQLESGEKHAILNSISDDPIELFEGFVNLFMQSEDDKLFNQIIYRITTALSIPIVIEHTLDENYDTIFNAIGDKNKTFWLELGKEKLEK